MNIGSLAFAVLVALAAPAHVYLIASGALDHFFIHRIDFQRYATACYDTTHDSLSIAEKPVTFDPVKIKSHDVIFVRTACLDEYFKKMHPRIKAPYILVTHIDDDGIGKKYLSYLNDPKIIAWFGINPDMPVHPKFYPLPIGIYQMESVHKQKNELIALCKQLRKLPKNDLVYLNFTDASHTDRVLVRRLFADQPWCLAAHSKSFIDYLKQMAMCKFAFSPRGNGLDCYRTWEALAVGCIPIVLSSYLDPLYKHLPVLIINDWKQITPEFLDEAYQRITLNVHNFQKLTSDWYIRQIEALRS